MAQFKIAHLFGLTVIASIVSVLISWGELGMSTAPTLLFPLTILISHWHQPRKCPEYLKIRYHLPIAFALVILEQPSAATEFGWWVPPLNIVAVFIGFLALIMLQLVKLSNRGQPNIELRLQQIAIIWFIVTMVLVASIFGSAS